MNGSGLDLEVIFSGFREFKLHEYSKRQTLDSNWEFLKKENELIKTAQTILMDKNCVKLLIYVSK